MDMPPDSYFQNLGDAMAEDITGKWLPRTPEQGIADMRERIANAHREIASLENSTFPDRAEHIAAVKKEIVQHELRLKAYELQKDGRN